MRELHSQRLLEAVVVGLALLPLYDVAEAVATRFVRDPGDAKLLTVFLSGFSFHLVAEALQLNDMYTDLRLHERFVGEHPLESQPIVAADRLQCCMVWPSY